jgi:hypothetical protein
VSLEERESGLRLWIHAAAVAERLSAGSPLDLWLRDQAEALCVGRTWLPLLPSALSKAASFAPGQTEAALSVALDLDAEGVLEHFRFCRSRIRPDGLVDGAVLQALSERKPKSRTLPAALKGLKEHLPLIERLIALAGQLRDRRLAAGSLDLDLPTPAIASLGDLQAPDPDLAREGWLPSFDASQAAALLRELTVPAHQALGQHLAALELPALFATNPAPEADDVDEVAKAALALEIPWSSPPMATPAPRSWPPPSPAPTGPGCCNNSCVTRCDPWSWPPKRAPTSLPANRGPLPPGVSPPSTTPTSGTSSCWSCCWPKARTDPPCATRPGSTWPPTAATARSTGPCWPPASSTLSRTPAARP